MNTNENIINKLKYLGINFEEDIPDIIKNFRRINYIPSKYNNEHAYKIYRYIDIKDIQILLTPTNRLNDITEKYKKAMPLYEYLNPDKEESLERYAKFLSMVGNIDVSKINKIEEQQKMLNQQIPFKVKYSKDYLWQIYYSEYTEEYFMLVPTEDLEYSAFFYLLKKQLSGEHNQKIFVPISHVDYTREYLNRMQISDIENCLWLFTKEWPLVYEVYDKENKLSLHLTGKARIFDDIYSDYKIELNDKEGAIKFYKLLKALFIMQTEMPHRFNFTLGINEQGGLEFYSNGKKIIYEILPSLIKEEYLKAEEEKIELIEEKLKLEKELDELQKKSTKLEKEYLEREKQIATYLVCKRTFFGRVKYFFKYKKVNLIEQEDNIENNQEIKIIRLNKYGEVKSNYTLEELIELYKQIDKEEIKEKNLSLDIKAIKQRIKNLESKVKNAVLYIEEIDKNKKSIFEFWKFTNKDKQEELPEGVSDETNKESLKKVFDYELDFEDLSINLDKTQRENLTKQELDSIYLTTTQILEDINKVAKKKEITNERLEELKKEVLQKKELLEKDNFDIFGRISYDNKLKILANQKHRETEKDVFRILDINRNTTIQEYTDFINEVIKKLTNAFEKIKIGIELSVYKCSIKNKLDEQYNIFDIKGTQAIEKNLYENIDTIEMYKINLKENTKVLAITNNVYYDNTNKTLPLGMNIEQSVLLDNTLLNLKETSENKINIVCYKDKNNELSQICIKKIKIKEFTIVE